MFSSYSFSPPFQDTICVFYFIFLPILAWDRLHLTLSQDLMDETFSFLRSLQKAQTTL